MCTLWESPWSPETRTRSGHATLLNAKSSISPNHVKSGALAAGTFFFLHPAAQHQACPLSTSQLNSVAGNATHVRPLLKSNEIDMAATPCWERSALL